jgi:hypothetical protein
LSPGANAHPAQYSPDLFVDRARAHFEYVIEITLPRIEYVKSAALVVESDEPKGDLLALFHVLVGQIGKLQRCRQAPGVVDVTVIAD